MRPRDLLLLLLFGAGYVWGYLDGRVAGYNESAQAFLNGFKRAWK